MRRRSIFAEDDVVYRQVDTKALRSRLGSKEGHRRDGKRRNSNTV
jgi:hypothetical protein